MACMVYEGFYDAWFILSAMAMYVGGRVVFDGSDTTAWARDKAWDKESSI